MHSSGMRWRAATVVELAILVLAACSHLRPGQPGSSAAGQSASSRSPSAPSSAQTPPSGSSTSAAKSSRSGDRAVSEGTPGGGTQATQSAAGPESASAPPSSGQSTNRTPPRVDSSRAGASTSTSTKRGATTTAPGGAKSGAAAASGAGTSGPSPGATTAGAGSHSGQSAAASNARPATTSLDLAALEDRLRSTHAIGVFTKLSLKNQVDDLLGQFRAFHARKQPPLSELRQQYDVLLMKVMSLLQDGDPPLAAEISSSREALWDILTDPQKFAKL